MAMKDKIDEFKNEISRLNLAIGEQEKAMMAEIGELNSVKVEMIKEMGGE